MSKHTDTGRAGTRRGGKKLWILISVIAVLIIAAALVWLNSVYVYAGGLHRRDSAQIDLRGKGFTVTVSEDYSDVVPDGCVISTSPAAGEKVSAGATVVLLVSKGEKIETTVVPNFVGTTSVDAYELLVKSDLRLGTISYRYDEYADYGIIVEQSLSMGTTVPKGMAKINFIISKGPEPAVTAPVTAATTEPTEPAQTTTDFDDWLSGRFH